MSVDMWALFLIFLILKLCNVITWSWIWVFAPLWIPLSIIAIWYIIYILIETFKKC